VRGSGAATLATDAEGLLDTLGEPSAAVVAIDAGVPGAFLFAMRRPERVRRLVVMESVLGGLPGAEDFLAPWWFGFHAVPGLAEDVLLGNEARYVDWFLAAGARDVPSDIRDAFVDAFTGRDAMRHAFSCYRALPESTRQIGDAVAQARLTVPTMAIGAHPVGDALARQLRPIADDLIEHLIPGCRHIIPLDRPRDLLRLVTPFLTADTA
jgi:pimeloyl-ACP methyl ester carboxylesterase